MDQKSGSSVMLNGDISEAETTWYERVIPIDASDGFADSGGVGIPPMAGGDNGVSMIEAAAL